MITGEGRPAEGRMDMRPKSITRFEQLYLLSLVIGLGLTILSWDASVAMTRQAGGGPGLLVAVQGLTFAILLTLVLLISRRASVIAKWVLILLFLGGLAIMFVRPALTFGDGPVLAAQIVQIAIQLAALYFLFTPEARIWFGGTSRPA